MTVLAKIGDGGGSEIEAKVSVYGQLITAPISYNTLSFQLMNATGTAFNFAVPVADERIVISGMVINAGKNVSATTAADIVIYKAAGPTLTASLADIISIEMLKAEREVITGLNIITDPGVWINATTTDADIKLSLLYYYLKEV